MKHTRAGAPIAVLLASTSLWVSPALAQQEPGLRATFSFGQTIEATDNDDFEVDPSGTDVFARTDLGFTLRSQTRSQSFRLNLGTVLEGAISGDSDGFEFVRDTARVDYTRENSSSRLSLGAFYSDEEIDDLELEVDLGNPFFDPDLLIFDGGSVERIGGTARLQTGLNAPFGLDISARFSETSFVDTVDPDLEDSQRYALNATASFRINPALTARALAGVASTREEDAVSTERDTRFVGVGLSGETRGGLSFRGDLTFDESDTTTTLPSDESEDGIGLDLSVTQDRPNGTLGARLSTRVDESGRVTQASVNRAMDLPDGQLAFSLGLIDPDDDSIRPTASLDFLRELPLGQISAQLTQSPSNDDGETVLNTALRLNYTRAINPVSSISAGVTYSEANTLGSDDDTTVTSASLNYRRNLSEAWGLRAGYNYTLRDDDGQEDRDENSIFLSVERDFSFGF